ncbi:DUF3800 domain-containing protein [Inquilinus sp. YAF38]|uniref:DUF3800 domain-containing protein n=1 Tax=Inquilinus sp. YAF38 TaxID=3233084 RepID=UPI003F90A503
MKLILPRLISCDESGFTGNDMLNKEQPFFAYASHDLELAEAEALVAEARGRFPIQMKELKSSKLLKTNRGRDFLEHILARIEGRYIVTIYEKRLSIMCKLFEYIYEPVLQNNNYIFYKNNMHRFVAMYLYMQLIDAPMVDLIAEFEKFMRSLDPSDAPTFFSHDINLENDDLLNTIIRFARGYNVTIVHEARDLMGIGDSGKWILDLTSSAVFSHLTAWGERHDILEVVCDDSKPLLSIVGFFDAMINRPDRVSTDLFNKERNITWNMSKPIAFTSSDSHPGIQIADLIAGVAANIPTKSGNSNYANLLNKVVRHLHEDIIMPDFDVLKGDQALINWLVLLELAARADRGDDPLYGIEDIYSLARRSLPGLRAKIGDFNA